MTHTRVSSRISKKQQNQAVVLSIVFGVLAVGLGMVFLFVILPNFGRISQYFDSSSGIAPITDTVPPQRPQLVAVPAATNSASMKISGYTEPKSTAVLVWDGSQAKQMGVDDEGSFSFSVLLKEGRNTLAVFAEDAAANQSQPSAEVVVEYDSIPPKLEITNPQPNQSFQGTMNQRLTITGITDPGSKVYSNDRLISVAADGSFSNTLVLQEGANSFLMRARDAAGNETSVEVLVQFSR